MSTCRASGDQLTPYAGMPFVVWNLVHCAPLGGDWGSELGVGSGGVDEGGIALRTGAGTGELVRAGTGEVTSTVGDGEAEHATLITSSSAAPTNRMANPSPATSGASS